MFFKKQKEALQNALEALETTQSQLESLTTRLDEAQKVFSDELSTVKSDMAVLFRSLKEMETPDEKAASQPVQPAGSPEPQNNSDYGEQLQAIRKDLTGIQEWTKSVAPALKTINDNIFDAKKDIKNKITYATSQLKR